MEINRHNYKIIKEVNPGDKIIFRPDLVYYVADMFITRYGGNELIFETIGVEKYNFCQRAYRYEPGSGQCPTCKPYDYSALYRLIVAIFNKLLEKEIDEQELNVLKLELPPAKSYDEIKIYVNPEIIQPKIIL